MLLFNVFNVVSGHSFGAFYAATGEGAISMMMADAGGADEAPSADLRGEPLDVDLYFDRVEADNLNFDVSGIGAIPDEIAFLRVQCVDGRPRIGYSSDPDANLYAGESWNWLNIPDAQAADDVANVYNITL